MIGQPIEVIVGLPLVSRGPAYTAVCLAEAIQGEGLQCRMYAPINRWDGGSVPFQIRTGGVGGDTLLDRILYRAAPQAITIRAENRLLRALETETLRPLVYTFSEVSLRFSETLAQRGVRVVREKTNCGKRTARAILEAAYQRLGAPPAHGITEAMIAKEDAELKIADAVFCPSPMVRSSLVDDGVPPEKLILTSYGWEPSRFQGAHSALPPAAGPTLLFAGAVCVRKGAHILLEAWKRAKIRGRLVLVGKVERLILERYSDVLSQPDVVVLGYRADLPDLLRASDWFVFPTLEEGGPLVTYEAASMGLALMVSKMGAGAFARDGVDGLVIDDDDPDAWAAEIASLPGREDERRAFGASGKERALDFTWARVGERRRGQLLALINNRWANEGSTQQ